MYRSIQPIKTEAGGIHYEQKYQVYPQQVLPDCGSRRRQKVIGVSKIWVTVFLIITISAVTIKKVQPKRALAADRN